MRSVFYAYDQCLRCKHRGEEHPLCDHYALADAEMDEVGMRDPLASDEGIALGHDIQAWRDRAGGAFDPGRCPGFDACGHEVAP